MSKPPFILFKYPSRGRPDNFIEGLNSIYNNLMDDENFHVSCTFDTDDQAYNNIEFLSRLAPFKNLSVGWGTSTSKINAVNRTMPDVPWDIVCVHSDDMLWQFYGFDDVIRDQFKDGDFDKLVHVEDSDAKAALATYYIAGRTFYNKFGYIYDPRFKSLWCDNLVMDIAKMQGVYRYVDCPGMLFHKNPAYGHQPKDEMFLQQQSYWDEDEKTYQIIKFLQSWKYEGEQPSNTIVHIDPNGLGS